MMEEAQLNQLLRLSLQRALLGEVYPSLRAVAFYVKGLKKLKVIYYLDREPSDMDYESLSDVCGEILSDLDFEEIEEICEYTMKPFLELSYNNNFVYLRKE
jgi:hypothetical protein